MANSYSIRPAGLRDARSIAAIHSDICEIVDSQLIPPEFFKLDSLDSRLDFWRDAIEYGEPQVLLATTPGEDKIVGFVGFDRSRDAGTQPTVGEIWAIYVLPAYWGTGAGLALWDAAREGLLDEGCTQVTIWLPLANERALRFHELAGFKRENGSARTIAVSGFRLEHIRLKRSTV
jgi:GNAT superfamily N-acetyltransferase